MLEGRGRRVVERYLRSLSALERQAIRAISIDPYDAYRQAVRHELPQAQIICDPFHLVRGANEALETVRRERQLSRRFVVASKAESRVPAVGGSSSSTRATGCSRLTSGSASSSGARSASSSRRSH